MSKSDLLKILGVSAVLALPAVSVAAPAANDPAQTYETAAGDEKKDKEKSDKKDKKEGGLSGDPYRPLAQAEAHTQAN